MSKYLCVMVVFALATQQASAALVPLTGGDFGEGYVGTANTGVAGATLVYAQNFGPATPPTVTMQGDLFGNSTPTGVTLNSGGNYGGITAPFSPSLNDTALNTLYNTVEIAPSSGNFIVADVTPGRDYLLQLITIGFLQEPNVPNTVADFVVNGNLVDDNAVLQSNPSSGWFSGATPYDVGSNVLAYQFLAGSSSMTVQLNNVGSGNNANVVAWSLIDVTPIPEPSSFALAGLGMVVFTRQMRRRQ